MRREKICLGPASLKIYLVLLAHGKPMGVRELQRILGLKSPSTVKYHLERLLEAGYVKRLPDGSYVALRSSESPASIFITFLGLLIPRLIPIALTFIAFALTYLVLNPITDPIPIISTIVLAVIVVIESLRIHKFVKRLVGM